ncbi:hypothetical protein BSLG_001768 [Batrachochytrium salamandrivorans]|nr:hypothetical protein BSLG_001768 [Batrachochytrium salamandrivorans]
MAIAILNWNVIVRRKSDQSFKSMLRWLAAIWVVTIIAVVTYIATTTLVSAQNGIMCYPKPKIRVDIVVSPNASYKTAPTRARMAFGWDSVANKNLNITAVGAEKILTPNDECRSNTGALSENVPPSSTTALPIRISSSTNSLSAARLGMSGTHSTHSVPQQQVEVSLTSSLQCGRFDRALSSLAIRGFVTTLVFVLLWGTSIVLGLVVMRVESVRDGRVWIDPDGQQPISRWMCAGHILYIFTIVSNPLVFVVCDHRIRRSLFKVVGRDLCCKDLSTSEQHRASNQSSKESKSQSEPSPRLLMPDQRPF